MSNQTYHEILERIFTAYPMYHKVGSAAYKEGLENIEALLEIIGNPQRKLRCVHVAGTNGKGSVSSFLSSYFQELGYKTGLFTSPHLVDFRERIRINGEMITEEKVLDFFDKYQEKFQHLEPSFFEITTALAFHYFAEQKVDFAVIEVGLGGRLDSTNVITPLLSVITNISLEHTQLLGNTIAKIAFEKAGIIKNKVPVVIGEYHPESFPVFEDVALKHDAPLFPANVNYEYSNHEGRLDIYDKETHEKVYSLYTPFRAHYQDKNILTFFQAAKVLEFVLNIQEDKIGQAVENMQVNTGLTGRWQVLSENPRILCDVGHNYACLQNSMTNIYEERPSADSKIHVVFGMVNDKDIDHILPLLRKEFTYYVCRAHIERAMDQEKLAAKMREQGLSCETYSSVEEAIAAAKEAAKKEDVIFITGSCFVVGEALSLFNGYGL
ncbi:MAG: bifunctional folylpolyglutamate synthase/dihydrofolate synthase [Bacteroidales bacterium]|nr:bifunctional folylpolyglutamate synthase/dihydrofolate synthase [Bacteroidales bacterium]